MVARFNPPPGWPTTPPDWTPPPGWTPNASWPTPPPGWELFLPDPDQTSEPATAAAPMPPHAAPVAHQPSAPPVIAPQYVAGPYSTGRDPNAAPLTAAAPAAAPLGPPRRHGGVVAAVIGGALVLGPVGFGVSRLLADSADPPTAATTEPSNRPATKLWN